jgi:hypothetical protein
MKRKMRLALYMYIARVRFLYTFMNHTRSKRITVRVHSILKFMHINTQRVGTYSGTAPQMRKFKCALMCWSLCDGAPTSACEGELANAAAASTILLLLADDC